MSVKESTLQLNPQGNRVLRVLRGEFLEFKDRPDERGLRRAWGASARKVLEPHRVERERGEEGI